MILLSPFFFNFSSSVFQVFYIYSASSSYLSKDVGLNTSTSLLHLKPYTRYKVEVQAFTGAGGGKKTSVSVKTDETGMFLILALKGSMSTYIFFRLIFIHIFEELIQENVSKDQEMFPFGDLFINSHEHFSWFCVDIIRRKIFKLIEITAKWQHSFVSSERDD